MRGESVDPNERMIQLCLEAGAPSLTRRCNHARSLDRFIWRKPDAHPCHLSKQYVGIENPGWGWQIGFGTATRFKKLKE